MLKRLILKLFLQIKGVRFYNTFMVPVAIDHKKIIFEMINGDPVEFYFYKEHVEDYVFKYGTVKKKKFTGYVIRADFKDNVPEELHQFNNLKFFFNSSFSFINDDDLVCQVLLSIYLDFLHTKLQTK